MKTWNVPDEGGNLILKSGCRVNMLKPSKKGISKFRPLGRPFPKDIREAVPALLAPAAELWRQCTGTGAPDGPVRFQAALLDLCTRAAAHMQQRLIVETQDDLAKAVRQALWTGNTVPTMEWWRHGTGQADMGSMFLKLRVASFWGCKPVSVIDHTSDYQDRQGVFGLIHKELETAVKNGSSPQATPQAQMLSQAMDQYVKKFERGGFGASYTSHWLFVQSFIYEHENAVAQTPEFAIYQVIPQPLKKLESMWNMPAGGPGSPPPDDFVNGYKVGNMLDPNNGRFWWLYDNSALQQQQSVGSIFTSGGKKSKTNETDYMVALDYTSALPDDVSAATFQQWDEIIHIPTRAEAWMIALGAMGPQATAYAGRAEIDLLPATIKELAQQFAMPGHAAVAPGWGGGVPAMAGAVPGFPPTAPGAPAPLPVQHPVAPGAPAAPVVPGFAAPAAPAAAAVPGFAAPAAPQAPAAVGAPMTPGFAAPGAAGTPPTAAAPMAPAAPGFGAVGAPSVFAPAPAAPAAPQVPTNDMIPQIPGGVNLPADPQQSATTGQPAVDAALADLGSSLAQAHAAGGIRPPG